MLGTSTTGSVCPLWHSYAQLGRRVFWRGSTRRSRLLAAHAVDVEVDVVRELMTVVVVRVDVVVDWRVVVVVVVVFVVVLFSESVRRRQYPVWGAHCDPAGQPVVPHC